MSDDFFADLVALKPKPGSSPVDENGRAAVGGAFDQDAVLASGVDTSKGIQSPEVETWLSTRTLRFYIRSAYRVLKVYRPVGDTIYQVCVFSPGLQT